MPTPALGNRRLSPFGTDVEQLFGGRFRVLRRWQLDDMNSAPSHDHVTEEYFNDYGDEDLTPWGSDEAVAPDGFKFTDCVLTRQYTTWPPGLGLQLLVKEYETVTSTFVDTQEPRKSVLESGLGRLDVEQIGSPTAAFTGVVGTTTKVVDGKTYYLANVQEVESTESLVKLNTVWLQAGILSRSEDLVGSQKAEVVEAFVAIPTATLGGVLANKQESNVGGVPTFRYTFLKPSILSTSEDKVGSQKAQTIEAFNLIPNAPSGYSLANEQESNVDGIKTRRYTFLKPSVLSQSEDKVGSQLAITIQAFNQTPTTPAGYSLANEQINDFEGIPTRSFTFLKNDVQLSESEDLVGSQNAITEQWFNPSGDKTKTGYSLARTQTSDFEGIKTVSYTFLKDDVQLSESEDKVGSQNAITEQWFKPASTKTKVGYSLARTQTSDFSGIKTVSYTFLKDDVKLSESKDFVGSQLAITEQWFNPPEEKTKNNYSLARTQTSDIEGIKTVSYTFLKDNVKLSESEDLVGSQNAITEQWFKPAGGREIKADYSLAREQTSDFEGIKTIAYTFLKPSILSVRQERIGGQQQVVVQAFDRTEAQVKGAVAAVTDDHLLVDVSDSDFEGIKTTSYTFNIDEFTIASGDESGLFSNQRTELSTEVFASHGEIGVTPFEMGSDQLLAREEIDNGNAIKRRTSLFRQKGILAVSTPLVGGQQQVQVQAFGLTEAEVIEELDEVVEEHVLVSVSKSNYQGFQTIQYTFEVELFDIRETTENGLLSITRTELDAEPFESGDIGTDNIEVGSITLYLFREEIDNGNALKRRVSRWLEAGILTIRPVRDNAFSETLSYVYVTLGIPASGFTTIPKPDGTTLTGTLTWMEPEVDNFKGYPRYTQMVVTVAATEGGTLVHQYDKFYQVTDPGVMRTDGAFASGSNEGAAVRYPIADSQPKTYRKKALVRVFLTTSSNISETEVAYNEKDIDWCGITFYNFYIQQLSNSASVSANWRSFPGYLRGDISFPTDTAFAQKVGVYNSISTSISTGSILSDYIKAGVYRVEITPWMKTPEGTQLFLKTVITF
jgi:hypothetical protein